MAIEAQPKWEAKVSKMLNKHKPEDVWPFFEDFCSFNKWLPSIDTCYKVGGVEGQPGLIRYCAATLPPPPDGTGGEETIKWCHEKLLEVDPIKKCLTYEVLDNNMGFKTYRSTLEVLPSMDGGDDDQKGCLIEWSFFADPIEGLRFEDMVAYLDSSLQGVAENIERALENK